MPAPDIKFGMECRERMLRGFVSMARVLALTLGPQGGHIASQRVNSAEAEVLRDGATIVRRITELPHRVENAGAMMMRHIAWQMRNQVGDGSATAAVLACRIARDLHRLIAAGADPTHLFRGVEIGVLAATHALAELSTPLKEENQIAGLANTAVHEPEICQLLGEMFPVLGPYASITIQPGYGTGHDYAFREGSRFKGEPVSRYLLSDPLRHIAALQDTYVLVADVHFDTAASVAPILNLVARTDRKRLFIICKNMWEQAIHTLSVNNRRSAVTAYAATIKPIEDLRRDMMMDIALLTGATFVTDAAGMSVKNLRLDDLGYADRIVATQEYVMFGGGGGEQGLVHERIQSLRTQLSQTGDHEEKEHLIERIGRLGGGIGDLYIGGYSEHERTELIGKAAQAVKVIQAGLEGGVLPGGGAAYLAVIPAVAAASCDEGEEAMGVRVVARALEEPLRVLAGNAQANVPLVLADCRAQGPQYAYEVGTHKVTNMVDAHIMDATTVVLAALRSAASGAMMLASTQALVLPRNPTKSFKP